MDPHGKRKNKPRFPLQGARSPDAKQRPHEKAQIPRCYLHEIPFGDFPLPTQPTPSRSPRLARVRKAPLHTLPPQPLQSLVTLPATPPAIAVKRLFPPLRFVRPHPPIRLPSLGNIGPNSPLLTLDQLRHAVIPVVGH